jgi:hypothetical protein
MEIEAAADQLPPEQKQELFLYLAGSLRGAGQLPPTSPQRIAGLHPGALAPAPDFDAPLPDDFWTGQK